MKTKLFALTLCLTLCLGIFTGCTQEDTPTPGSESTVSAAPGEVVLAIANVNAAPGDKVEVPVTITADSGACAIDLQIVFDTEALTYDSFEAGKIFDGGIAMDNLAEPGVVKLSLATLNPPKEAGELGVLTFTVPADAPTGEIALTLTCNTLVDYDSKELKGRCENGVITVK